ncbi:hypothetical protein [Psychroserpens algicola]|uniref:Uncharacterized protein n=1 Tax=Psychroserpens algicola TaxID=1719034 RepID=A0ABT0H632_9FLAO|nr:hypothetical protein [Psychroserpens algicola]MCK8479260.1 hypothetical protein [Psychroserpens algicola]
MKESSLTAKKNPIDINDAINYARNWRTAQPKNCKAFLIPAEDLIDTLEEMGVIAKETDGHYSVKNVKNSGVRAYMGIDPSEPAGGGEKLLLVGTSIDCNGKHRDIVQGEKSPGCPSNFVMPNPIGSGVYDLTTPCPSECDTLSPLENG